MGTRMLTGGSQMPKVLLDVCGRPMVQYVVEACQAVGVDRIILVVGFGEQLVREAMSDFTNLEYVQQIPQRGTGHAVQCCREALSDFVGCTLVMCGDSPLGKSETLHALIEQRERQQVELLMGTVIMNDPRGYGRIIRDEDGNLEKIIEQPECNEKQAAIREVNPSVYCFKTQPMLAAVEKLVPSPVKKELYLTDTLEILRAQGYKVAAYTALTEEEVLGANTPEQLEEIEQVMRRRLQSAGVG